MAFEIALQSHHNCNSERQTVHSCNPGLWNCFWMPFLFAFRTCEQLKKVFNTLQQIVFNKQHKMSQNCNCYGRLAAVFVVVAAVVVVIAGPAHASSQIDVDEDLKHLLARCHRDAARAEDDYNDCMKQVFNDLRAFFTTGEQGLRLSRPYALMRSLQVYPTTTLNPLIRIGRHLLNCVAVIHMARAVLN